MPDFHPLVWAAIFTVLLIAAFELIRLGRLSGMITVNSSLTVLGFLDLINTLPLTVVLGEKSTSLVVIITGIVNWYGRARTGDIIRPAPNLIGTGDGSSRTLGTGDGRR